MKVQAVIKALTRQFLDARDMARGQIRAKLDDDFAVFKFKDDCVFRVQIRLGRGVHREGSDQNSKKEGQDLFGHLHTLRYVVTCILSIGFSALGKVQMKRKALLLDRDGVINVDHGFVGQLDRFSFIPEIFDLLRRAQDCGYRLAVVTNQSGVARGLYTLDDFETVNRAMLEGFAARGVHLDLVLACFYHPEGLEPSLRRTSFWRKPDPGMILEAALKLDLDLGRSLMIGDKTADMLTAQAAGVGTCLLYHPSEILPGGARRISNLKEAESYL